MEIHFELHAPVLQVHPLFRFVKQASPATIRLLCHSAVRTIFLSQGDVLFVESEVKEHPEMYFVTKGVMEYHRGVAIDNVSEGGWVAEPVLWCSWRHRGTLKAHCDSELLALGAES